MWEYKRVEFKYKDINDLTERLNDIGKNEWEIIYYHEEPNHIKVLLKKPKHGKE